MDKSSFTPTAFRKFVYTLSKLPRTVMLMFSIGVGCFLITLFTILLSKDGKLAVLLLDYSSYSNFPYPFTIQNLLYILFFLALGELFVRWNIANSEHAFLAEQFLPEDDSTVLKIKDLGAIRQSILGKSNGENGFLPYLIDLSILQVQASRSVDQAVNVLNSTIELMSHKVDLRYSMLRYISWAIPTVGFIGTVVGIANALAFIDPEYMDLAKITGALSVAFNTTIVALILSAIVVLLQSIVQKREELALNRAGNYCLKNLINRLFIPQEQNTAA